MSEHYGWWCAFRPNGEPVAVTNSNLPGLSQWVAGREYSKPGETEEDAWLRISADGYTVRPITITEAGPESE